MRLNVKYARVQGVLQVREVSEIVKKIQADSDTKKRFDASNLTAPTLV